MRDDANFPAVAEAVARALLGEPTRGMTTRHELRFGRRGSIAVRIAGRARGTFFDHEAGAGGGVVALVQHVRRCSPAEAAAWLRDGGFLGDAPRNPTPRRPAPPPPRPAPALRPPATLDLARQIWAQAGPARGTAVEAYLRHRGVALIPGAPLRFHPACPRRSEPLPAMVALMTDALTNQPCGVHRTFLRPDGLGKAEGIAKMMAGAAGIVRLSPDETVTGGLGICEGVETGLALLTIAEWSPIWACCSAGGVARLPVLRAVEALTIFADRDDKGAGIEAARSVKARWDAAGRNATIVMPPAGNDWLDALTAWRAAT